MKEFEDLINDLNFQINKRRSERDNLYQKAGKIDSEIDGLLYSLDLLQRRLNKVKEKGENK